MTDRDAATSPDPLLSVFRHWKVSLGLVVVGALFGLLLSSTTTTVYTAEARLAVGADDLNAYEVAGYAVGAEEIASNYARYLRDSPTVSVLLRDAVGEKVRTFEDVTASPIPESSVLRVEVTGTEPSAARRAATAIAEDLAAQSSGADTTQDRDELVETYSELGLEVSRRQAQLGALNRQSGPRAQRVRAEISTLQMQQNALGVAYQQSFTEPADLASQLSVIAPGAIASDSRVSTVQIFVLSGAFVGGGLALFVGLMLDRRRRT